MSRDAKVAWGILIVGAVLLIVLAFDFLMSGLEVTAKINEPASIRAAVLGAYGLDKQSQIPPQSCFNESGSFNPGARSGYLSCENNALIAGPSSFWSGPEDRTCNPVAIRGQLVRDFPLTSSHFFFLIFAAGKTAAEINNNLDAARALPRSEYVQRFTLNEGRSPVSESNFYDAPRPDIVSIDCDGFSITRLEYAPVASPRT